MTWQSYNLDRYAHDLVLKYRDRDVLNQTHKMRMAVAYGLERFWGEPFRLDKEKDTAKAEYWRETWTKLVEIMERAGIKIPNDTVKNGDTAAIQKMAEKLWDFDQEQRKVALAVLTQLCDSMVWWAQRYKPAKGENNDEL